MKRVLSLILVIFILSAAASSALAADDLESVVPVKINTVGTVEITPLDGAPIPAQTRVEVDRTGSLHLSFTEEGSFRYEVRQIPENVPTVIYDDTLWIVDCTVKADEHGRLALNTDVYPYSSDHKEPEIVFENKASVDLDIPHTVHYIGPPHRPETTFQLWLTPVDDAPMPEGMDVLYTETDLSEEKPNETSHMSLIFTDEGEYYYTLHQHVGKEEGVVYDDTVYDIKVVVTRDERTGALTAKWYARISGIGEFVEMDLEHWNTWSDGEEETPIPCWVDPPVQKVIEGKVNAAEQFVFAIRRLDESYPMMEDAVNGKKEMTITGAGKKEFGRIVFTEPGVYEYEVTEKNTGIKGYTYDETVYILRYTVTVQEGNKLAAQETIFADGLASAGMTHAVFTNRYTKPDEPTPTPPDDPTPPDKPTPTPPEQPKPTLPTPRTSDDSGLSFWMNTGLFCLAGAAGLGVLFLVLGLIEKKKRAARSGKDGSGVS